MFGGSCNTEKICLLYHCISQKRTFTAVVFNIYIYIYIYIYICVVQIRLNVRPHLKSKFIYIFLQKTATFLEVTRFELLKYI